MRRPSLAIGITIEGQKQGPFMAMNDSSSDQQPVAEKKKPYEKPTFRHEQVFVTTALSCGKVSSGRSCAGSHKVS